MYELRKFDRNTVGDKGQIVSRHRNLARLHDSIRKNFGDGTARHASDALVTWTDGETLTDDELHRVFPWRRD